MAVVRLVQRLTRSRARLKAIAVLVAEEADADVVCESQEVVELLLKALLRSFGLPIPFSHDLSEVLEQNGTRLPEPVGNLVPHWSENSKQLRKDRELAFYGSEDITPSTLYTRADTQKAKAMAEEILSGVAPWIR